MGSLCPADLSQFESNCLESTGFFWKNCLYEIPRVLKGDQIHAVGDVRPIMQTMEKLDWKKIWNERKRCALSLSRFWFETTLSANAFQKPLCSLNGMAYPVSVSEYPINFILAPISYGQQKPAQRGASKCNAIETAVNECLDTETDAPCLCFQSIARQWRNSSFQLGSF